MLGNGCLITSLLLLAAVSGCANGDIRSSSGSVVSADAPGTPVAGAGSGSPSAAEPDLELVPSEAIADPDLTPDGQSGPAEKQFPFQLATAATMLGGGPVVEPTREALDSKTIEYTLGGSGALALLDQTEWATGPEAEFECSRASNGGSLVVGSDRMLFVAGDAVWFASGSFCTRVSVKSGSSYAPDLTLSLAQSTLAQ